MRMKHFYLMIMNNFFKMVDTQKVLSLIRVRAIRAYSRKIILMKLASQPIFPAK